MTDQKFEIPGHIRDSVEGRMRLKIVAWQIPDCGLSAAFRATLTFEDGSRAFLKAATDPDTEKWLRTEHYVVSSAGHSCMAEIKEWVDEEGTFPLLLFEDLSDAYWPASHAGVVWRDGDFERLFRGIEELSQIKGLDNLDCLKDPEESSWRKIQEGEKESFLALGLCSAQWFARHGDLLAREEMKLKRGGEDLLHGDIRSDNLCFKNGCVVFVDWSHATAGNGRLNQLDVLSGLHLEGGAEPFAIAPGAAPYAARSSAIFVRRLSDETGRPEWFRRVLRRLLAIDLVWFAKGMEIDPPEGIQEKELNSPV